MQLSKQRTTLVVVTVLVAVLVAVTTVFSTTSTETEQVRFHSNDTVLAILTVEIADTPRERETGLMNRSTLPEGYGMLFVFPQEKPRAFWMKHTYIPLDIVFLNADRDVINVEQADPQPNTSEHELTRYRSDAPARYVIEARQGFAAQHGIRPGTRVTWNRDS